MLFRSGSVIKQKLDRLSTRVALDYFVSDRNQQFQYLVCPHFVFIVDFILFTRLALVFQRNLKKSAGVLILKLVAFSTSHNQSNPKHI